ncbi:unnamed protein product, partial [Mesorhabditis belari]|uniref:Thaumatin-like protein n=1 Tax=Mesorhabditis belari TaxID=2138241 RepID=A0AAF3ED28_9BILA
MLRVTLLLAVVGSAASQCSSDGNSVCINIYNKCPFTIWPGVQGSFVPNGGGFKLNGGESKQLRVPNGWQAARIWARTGCDGNMNCETGDCGGNTEQCNGRGGVPPISLAEFTLNGAGAQDYYDVSLVDGYNIPVLIMPIGGTFNTNGGQYDCKMAGGCVDNLSSTLCPAPLRDIKNGNIVACMSACEAFNTDEYCCRGAHGTPDTCPPNQYSQLFKKACPGAYSYAYDDHTSTFFCRGNNGPSPAYTVQFC